MAETHVTIDSGHNGPPGSGHGGVTVGRLAELAGSAAAEVRLLAPPPLETTMAVRPRDDDDAAAGLVVGGPAGDVATVAPIHEDVVVEGFGLLPAEEVDRAARQFLDHLTETGHAFPTCFGCGPERGDEALRQFTGVGSDGDTLARFRVVGDIASDIVDEVADDEQLPDWLTIAGLDCPSGWTVSLLTDPAPAAVVLASMQCQVHEPTRAGVDYQVRGRLLSSDGRKHFTEVAMLDPEGRVMAAARALWIEVDPSTFGT